MHFGHSHGPEKLVNFELERLRRSIRNQQVWLRRSLGRARALAKLVARRPASLRLPQLLADSSKPSGLAYYGIERLRSHLDST